MQFGDFLNKLAGKLSLQNNSELVDFLSQHPELAQAEIGDGFATSIDTGLLSLAAAKQHAEVQKHFTAQTLNTVDEQLKPLFSKYGLDDVFAAERSSYKKIGLLEEKLAAKIAEAEAKAEKGGGADVERLKKDLLAMQTQLATVTAAKDKELADLRSEYGQKQLDMLVNFELTGKRYANADLGDTNVTIARALLDKALKEQNAVLVNEDGKIAIKQAGNTTLSLLDASNNPVVFSAFTDRLLADKHLLEVSGGGDPDPKPNVVIQQGGGGGGNTGRFDSAVAQSIADLKD